MSSAEARTRRAGPSGVRWRILALIFAASFVAYLLRTNMSVAGERMMGDLGLTHIQLGAVLAAFAWGYAAAQFPAGVWGGRVGARRALALAALAWGVLNLLVGLVPGRGSEFLPPRMCRGTTSCGRRSKCKPPCGLPPLPRRVSVSR